MKYALLLPPFGDCADARVLADLARDADQSGWDGFFIWDHVFMNWPDRVVDITVALTAIALATQDIRFGTLVTPLPRRRPWKLARETVTLDRLSSGRLTLGVGAGWWRTEYHQLGEETSVKVRAEMLDESLEILTGLWRGGTFSFLGNHYKVEDALFEPTPIQKPRIPIWVAGLWPNRAPMRRAARWDGVYALPSYEEEGDMTPPQVREMVSYIQEYRDADAPFDVIQKGETPGDDASRAAEIVEPYRAAGATWWLEVLSAWRYGHQGGGPWPMDAIRERILQGPPALS